MGVLGTLQSDWGAEGSHCVLNTLALITAFIPIIIYLACVIESDSTLAGSVLFMGGDSC